MLNVKWSNEIFSEENATILFTILQMYVSNFSSSSIEIYKYAEYNMATFAE